MDAAAFYALVVVALYVTHPPQGLVWLYALAALAIGTVLGWYRAKLMTITVDAQTHEVSQQGSMAAMLFNLRGRGRTLRGALRREQRFGRRSGGRAFRDGRAVGAGSRLSHGAAGRDGHARQDAAGAGQGPASVTDAPWLAGAAPRQGDRRHAPATLRNREAIADVLADVLPRRGTVLEVASGSGRACRSFRAGLSGARLAAQRSRSRRAALDRGLVRRGGPRQCRAAADARCKQR